MQTNNVDKFGDLQVRFTNLGDNLMHIQSYVDKFRDLQVWLKYLGASLMHIQQHDKFWQGSYTSGFRCSIS